MEESPQMMAFQFSMGGHLPFGHGGCHSRVAPQDVHRASGLEPYHTGSMDGEWRIGDALKQTGDCLVRREQIVDKKRDLERWPNMLFVLVPNEFVHVQRNTAVVYASSRDAAARRLEWFARQFKAKAARETPSFYIVNTSYGSLRAERVEAAIEATPQEGNQVGCWLGGQSPSPDANLS